MHGNISPDTFNRADGAEQELVASGRLYPCQGRFSFSCNNQVNTPDASCQTCKEHWIASYGRSDTHGTT